MTLLYIIGNIFSLFFKGLVKEEKVKKLKRDRVIGEFGVVETITHLYEDKKDQSVYDVQQTIKRFEPIIAKGNLAFMAYYFRDKDNKKGVLHFFPRLYSLKEQEYCLDDWNFRLEFERENSDDKFCRMTMYSAVHIHALEQEIDIYTFGVLMTKFFEACDPHCQYDFKDIFIEVFRNSEYEQLKKYAERSTRDYEYYRRYNKKRNVQRKTLMPSLWRRY